MFIRCRRTAKLRSKTLPQNHRTSRLITPGKNYLVQTSNSVLPRIGKKLDRSAMILSCCKNDTKWALVS